MSQKITINSKDYNLSEIRKIDFNSICELEEMGLSLGDVKRTKMTSMRALLAYVGGMTVDEAGAQIMQHLKNGGSFDAISPLIDEFLESDFFQATRQPNAEEETPTSEGTAQA